MVFRIEKKKQWAKFIFNSKRSVKSHTSINIYYKLTCLKLFWQFCCNSKTDTLTRQAATAEERVASQNLYSVWIYLDTVVRNNTRDVSRV